MKILYTQKDDPRFRPPLGGPLLQGMPEGAVRLNPDAVQDLTAFVSCLTLPLARQARASVRGLKGLARRKALGGRRGALRACNTIAAMLARLEELVDAKDVAMLCAMMAADEPSIRAEQAKIDRLNLDADDQEGE